MKNFIKKNLAVLLSFAIIITTILPVLSVFVSADSYTAQQITELKNAWAALDVELKLTPHNVYQSDDVVKTNLTLNDSSSYEGTDLADTSVLGDKYATYTLANSSSAGDGNDRIEFAIKDKDKIFNVSQLKDFSVYGKNTVSNPMRPFFKVVSSSAASGFGWRCNGTSYYNADVITANAWVEFKMSNLPSLSGLWANGALGDVKDRQILGIGFDYTGNGQVTLGTMTATFAAASEATLALANSNADSFIAKAKSFYATAKKNGYYSESDTEFNSFKAALTDIVGDIDELARLEAVKEAWESLPAVKLSLVPDTVWDGMETPVSGITLNDTAAYIGTDLADKSVLGVKYAAYHCSGGGCSDEKDYILFNPSVINHSFTYAQLEDYSVYVKNGAAINIRPKYHYTTLSDRVWLDSAYFVGANYSVGSWIELKMSNLPNPNALKSTLATVKDKNVRAIAFDCGTNAGDMLIGTMTATFTAVSADTLALLNTDSATFYKKAVDFYLEAVANGYYAENDASFIAFGNAISAAAGSDVDKVIKVNELAKAWKALPQFDVMVPSNRIFGHTSVDVHDISEYTDNDLVDKSVLGEKYITFTVKTSSASDSVDKVIYYLDSLGKDIKVSQLKDFTVYVKTTGANNIRPFFDFETTKNVHNLQSLFAANTITVNGWNCLKMSELPQQANLLNALSGAASESIVSVNLDFGVESDVIIGSMLMTFDAVADSTLELKYIDSDAFISEAAKFYMDAKKSGYYPENSAEFKRFELAVSALAENMEFNYAINSIATSWSALPDAKVTLIPNEVVGENALTLYDVSAYSESDIDRSLLGDKYATYTVSGGGCSDDKDYIYFNQKNGNSRSFTLNQLKNFNFYAKNPSGVSIRPKIHYIGSRVWNDYSYFVGETYAGGWKEYKMSDLGQYSTLASKISSSGEETFKSIGVDCGGNAGELVVGSAVATFSSLNSEVLALKDTDIAAFISEAIKFSDEAQLNGYYDEGNAEFAAFKTAVDNLLNLEGYDEIFAVANLRAGWLTLSDNSSYPQSDTSDWTVADWVYVANKVDISGLSNTERFSKALADAIAIRDAKNMSLGCNLSEFISLTDATEALSNLGKNLISGKEPEVYYYDGNERTNLSVNEFSAISDGDFGTDFNISGLGFENQEVYVEMIYAFDGLVSVSDFLVGNSAAGQKIGKYRIYVADSVDKLFLSESIVATFENDENTQLQLFNYDGKPEISGGYIAVRLYGTATISEFGVYGEQKLYNVTVGDFTNEQMAAIGTSLLDSNNIKAYVKSGTGAKTVWNNSGDDGFKYPVNDLLDCNGATGIGLGDQTGTAITKVGEEIDIHIIFDLRNSYYIQKLLINHWHQNYLQTGKYNVRISDNIVTLLKDESIVLEYNNMADSENGTTYSQLFETLGNGVIGRYVDFNITVPISDYDKSLAIYGTMAYIRLCDIAVYGERYYKPLKEINFLSHMPVELYRTDESGNKVAISEAEYDGTDHLNAADGKYDVATPIAQNGKNIDILFNLCSNKTINSIKLSTLTENVKGLKVYASQSVEGVWNEDSCVMTYFADSAEDIQISRVFSEEPITARYVRFSIKDTESGMFDPTEFEVIGWNSQEFYYYNTAEEKGSSTTVWLENKDNYNLKITDSTANEYVLTNWIYPMSKAFDNDSATVADFFGGSLGDQNGKGRESINLLIDLQNLVAIDSIEFVSGSSSDYWPSEINFYAGQNDLELFGKDAKPLKQFTEKCSDDSASYSYAMLPQVVQYVRVEILNSTQEYYEFTNMVATVIEEIKVNGFEILSNTSSDGVAASLMDEETGIVVEVLALRENDVFSTFQGLIVFSAPATSEEKAAFAAQGVAFVSDIYFARLLDANGDVITDAGGRNVRINLPKNLFKGSSDPYVIAYVDNEYSLVEFDERGDYYSVVVSDLFTISAAFGEFVEIIEEDEEVPDNMDNTLTDEDDETESQDEAEDDDDKPKRKKKIKVVRKNPGDDFDYLWIIITAIAVAVVLAAGITIFLILKKKKNREEE